MVASQHGPLSYLIRLSVQFYILHDNKSVIRLWQNTMFSIQALTYEDGCQWKKLLGNFKSRKPSKTQLRVHQMETVEFALSIMKFEKMDLTNIGKVNSTMFYKLHLEAFSRSLFILTGASDIVDQNLKLILGVVWKLILKFQIGSTGKANQVNFNHSLLISDKFIWKSCYKQNFAPPELRCWNNYRLLMLFFFYKLRASYFLIWVRCFWLTTKRQDDVSDN